MSVVASGFAAGLSLIVAIGAQNAFVLRQGLRREHVAPVVLVCAGSDMVLIALGTAGLDLATTAVAWLAPALRYGGAAFLIVYGGLALRRALRPGQLVADPAGRPSGLGGCLATCLALTWLNPHVWLDTVLLLGSLANGQGDRRWWFAGGAMAASWLFFSALGYGARWLRPWFASAKSWRLLDGGVALVMWAVAASLLWRG
ncbi:MAG: LysE/ArgO family amino acid transporter [Propionibacteriaceae bacterium]|jgi:L-lysine exporter family protein LysE/ArgO|nr:LysE/ArgO family amino acid transporter [Propionibacteriaceae bacterium]